jgi:3,4-dihydroxy 2-butanone 4-phosphate synthase/GTP cyclohydrolase II
LKEPHVSAKRQNTAKSSDVAKRVAGDLEFLSPIEDIIEDARNGRMFILVDDEERENEGDLVIPAQMATPDAINFMATHGRGLICLAMTEQRCRDLGLDLMSQKNQSRHQTAFTTSIEAREGVTTGISAPDRARTVSVAIDPQKGKDDIGTPGHVFPLMAREGGVLVRAGHTEASVDIARLAGLNASGVICEIMNEDGTMARLGDLISYAQFHNLKIGAIADLIAYRRKHDRIVEKLSETDFVSRYGGDFKLNVYVNKVAYSEHIALVKGEITPGKPTLVRMHAVNFIDDVLGGLASGRGGDLQRAMEIIGEEGSGVVVVLREPQATHLSDLVARLGGNGDSAGPVRPPLRDYGVGAQILIDLGVTDMTLLSNTTRTVVGLDGYGLRIVGQRPIDK